MSTPLERFKLLMGGEEAVNVAEAKAIKAIKDKAELEASMTEKQTAEASQVEDKPKAAASLESGQIQQAPRQGRRGGSHAPDTNKQLWCSALRRGQYYLGLRLSNQSDLPTLDYTQAPSHPPHQDTILLALDIEADETNHSAVTEVGIATIDTRSLVSTAPGAAGSNWFTQVRGQHFRIAERAHIRNHLHVFGDPETFNAEFGTSQIVSLGKIAEVVRACFQQQDNNHHSSTSKFRNVVLVGHSIKGDIAWLRSLGVDLREMSNVIDVMETVELQKALKHDVGGSTSLVRLLTEMEVEYRNLHNAGNDAAYTLQGFVAIVLKSVSGERPVLELEERLREAAARAVAQATEEAKAWDSAEIRSADGYAVEMAAYRLAKLS